MKTLSVNIMGSTGSIGTQALEICEARGIKVNGISANRSIKLLEEQIRKFSPPVCHVYDEAEGKKLAVAVADTNTKVIYGKDALCDFAVYGGADTLLSSVMGSVGLKPLMCAVEKGMKIALANKETLVAAGSLVTKAVKNSKSSLIPVDSEHSAIFQCLMGNEKKALKKILLTASGGPFFGKTKKELASVTKKDALKHPNWSMGQKITVDSATMMNKGLEIIEARWLFDTKNIEVLVHRQSIVHSMVEYADNSVIAQMGVPSMKIPIQFAFTYPEREPCPVDEIDFTALHSLTFEKPDYETFGCLKIATDAMNEGGTKPLVMNAVNEIAVDYFLKDKIGFNKIEETVGEITARHKSLSDYTLDDCLALDGETRRETINYLERK